MGKPITKEDVIAHKKQAIRKLNNLLETYISDGRIDLLKKANLISYWLENFTTYVSAAGSMGCPSRCCWLVTLSPSLITMLYGDISPGPTRHLL